MTSCCATSVRVTTVELQTRECRMLTIILLSSSNQIDKPLHAVNSLALLVVLCYTATGYCPLPSDIVHHGGRRVTNSLLERGFFS